MTDFIHDLKSFYKIIIVIALFVGVATSCSPVLAKWDAMRGYTFEVQR